ncbi:MAG: NYN domain-containing protein [Leptolyngbyaceae cyanobacterium CSU_1_3]|nr:NYN domain-containing protein [Leptolyngbyaceae cyanobacterium CSU_1_3]
MLRSTPEAILLVDGYNIVGAWHDLKQVRDREGLEAARRRLVEALMGYSAFQGFETQVVFDAQYRDCPSNREVITEHLCVHYTDARQTADTYIERACADFRHDLRKFQQRLIVATSDRAQQLTVVGYGAEWMSAQKLANDVDHIARRVKRKQKDAKKPSGRFLFNSLDPIAQQRLSNLRHGKLEE